MALFFNTVFFSTANFHYSFQIRAIETYINNIFLNIFKIFVHYTVFLDVVCKYESRPFINSQKQHFLVQQNNVALFFSFFTIPDTFIFQKKRSLTWYLKSCCPTGQHAKLSNSQVSPLNSVHCNRKPYYSGSGTPVIYCSPSAGTTHPNHSRATTRSWRNT